MHVAGTALASELQRLAESREPVSDETIAAFQARLDEFGGAYEPELRAAKEAVLEPVRARIVSKLPSPEAVLAQRLIC